MDRKENPTRNDGVEITIKGKQSRMRKQIFQRPIRHELLMDIPYAVYAHSFDFLVCNSQRIRTCE